MRGVSAGGVGALLVVAAPDDGEYPEPVTYGLGCGLLGLRKRGQRQERQQGGEEGEDMFHNVDVNTYG